MDIIADSLSVGLFDVTDNMTVNGLDIVDYINSKIINSAKFVGGYSNLNDAPTENGNIVFVGTKEYIYSESQNKWIEIGDEKLVDAKYIAAINEAEKEFTKYKANINNSHKKTGIYSATRTDETKPIVINWGDGTTDTFDSNLSQVVHTYTSNGEFVVTISNIKTFAPSKKDSTWYLTTSENYYTLAEIILLGSSIRSISGISFYGCAYLTSMSISNFITAIEDSAFSYCVRLKELTFPTSVQTIGNYAFYGCSNLTDIIIPKTMTAIGSGVFVGCSALSSIRFENRSTSEELPTGSPYGASSATLYLDNRWQSI